VLEAYKNFWKKYVDFEGRTTRSDWWWVTLCNFIIFLLLLIPIMFSFINVLATPINYYPVYGVIFALLAVIYLLAILVPSIAMYVRRLRDADFHWALIFISFIPYVGGVVLFVLLQMPSKSIQNNKEMK
jgi:Predicted membrane protein